jgi:flavin reductase
LGGPRWTVLAPNDAMQTGTLTLRQSATDDFVDAMAAAVAGVYVVTTDGPGGRVGLTVSSMASVSAEPPRLLVCVNRRSPLTAAVERNGAFALSALGASQSGVADTFAGRPEAGAPYDFGCARWTTGAVGAPLLDGAAAWFDCVVAEAVDAGSHTIVIGDVTAAGCDVIAASDRGAGALAYTRRAYARPAAINAARRRV